MKKVGVGLIGVGWISPWHIRGYKELSDKVELVAVADIDEDKAKKVAEEIGAKYAVSSYKKLFQLDEVSAVDVSVPTAFHAEISIAALNSGKHVLCEKPFARNVRECEEMISAAEKNNVLLMPGHNRVFFPPHLLASEIIKEGKIGEPKIFQGNFLNGTPIAKAFKENWRSRKEMGGGVVREAGVHQIYMAERFIGKVKSVSAYIVQLKESEVETGAIAILEFENGGLGTIALSWGAGFYDDGERIVGTQGAIVVNGVEGQALRQPPLSIYTNKDRRWEFPNVAFDWDRSLRRGI